MTDFKTGPAKTRDGQEAFVSKIYPDRIEGNAKDGQGEWLWTQWEPNGWLHHLAEGFGDILPNNEPEWEYVVAYSVGSTTIFEVEPDMAMQNKEADIVYRRTKDGTRVEPIWWRGKDDRGN